MKCARTRLRRPALALAMAAVVAAGAAFATVRLAAANPPPTVGIAVPAALVAAPGTPPAIPAPPAGSLAIASTLDGSLAIHGADVVRPIASVAKALTALVVVHARPLPPGEGGPLLTMTPADVALWRQAVAEDGSGLAVRSGEVLSERDLLAALLLPSANNIAETLARWVSGSRAAFVGLANATARSLGMAHTSFADPSGFSAATVSTAADLTILAAAVLAEPALADLVGRTQWDLPDGTRITNLDMLLAPASEWLGIKTGWTPAAGGCLLFARKRVYAAGAEPVTVYGAVLGQPADGETDAAHPELGGAFKVATQAADAALSGYAAIDLATHAPSLSGAIHTRWGSRAAVVIGSTRSVFVTLRLGSPARITRRVAALTAPIKRGAQVGAITATVRGRQVISWPLVAGGDVGLPLWWSKLVNG